MYKRQELENKSLFQIDVDVDIPNLETTLIINPESNKHCLLYTSPSPRDYAASRMPSSA
ncbi:hypothetical protein JMUB7512_27840 [Staphylococcus aureus]